jgi:hypothetical protein
MGKSRGPYNAEYPAGSRVRIASRSVLEEFMGSWAHHNKLQPQQLDHADQVARVESVGFYHGGDELYQLQGIPGIWHEQCLHDAGVGADEVA